MTTATANGLQIEYDTFGNAGDPALLLIMGLGAQMTAWPEAFCRQLADKGLYVIRFDNRDVGLSSKIEGGAAPDMVAALSGDTSSASYVLDDMADDAAGLLDALGFAKAHIAGASMGGMIAQAFAIRHPERVLSLCSMMSTTGDQSVGQASPEAMAVLMSSPPTTREQAIEAALKANKAIGGTYPVDETRARAEAEAAYDRCYYPEGTARQLVAIIASGDRTERLHGVHVPTLVIHGEVDPLVNVSGGKATAAAIPGAKLLLVPGMGHDMPEQVWPEIVEAIVGLTNRAG